MFYKALDLKDLGNHNEEDLSNLEKLREISTNVVERISVGTNQIYNEDNVADSGDIFENIYLENGTKTVAQKIADMSGDTDVSPESRKEIGNLLIAQALLEDKSIVIKPVGKSMEDAIDLSAHYGDYAKENISILDRILAWIGIKSEAIIKEEKVRAIGKFVKKSAATKTESEALIEDSTLLAEVRRPVYDKARQELNAERNKLECLYSTGMGETECTDIEESKKRLAALPSTSEFNKRSWLYVCACVMLRDGHSMEDIFNPNYKPELRAEVGKEAASIAVDLASADSKVKTQAASKLANLYLEGGKKLLALPMPSKDELFNYPASNSKAFISAIPHMAFDLTQELDHLKPLVLNNPRDRAVYTSLNQVASLGAMSLPNKIMAMNFKKVPDDAFNPEAKKNVRARVIAMEATANVAKEMKFDYSGTISEALKKNADKLNKYQTFSAFASGNFDKEVLEAGDTLPLSLEKIMNGKESAMKRAELGEDYKLYYPNTVQMHAPNGSLKTVYERAELANNIADKVEKVSGASFSKDVKDKLANSIFDDPNFNNLTNTSAEKINSYVNDQKFFMNYMNSVDAGEKVKDAVAKANELSAERKEVNLNEEEIKKIDAKKAEKANAGPNL